MLWVALTAVVLLLVGCNDTTASQPSAGAPPLAPTPARTATPPQAPTPAPNPSPTLVPQPAPTASPTRMPLINLDDMMGMYPQQTVFVATPDRVSAVTLLNHFTRYRIATNDLAQVSVDASGHWLYVLDADTSGSHRLRAFEVATGSERGQLFGIGDVAQDQHALSAAIDGRILVLKSNADHVWVDAYAALTLGPLGPVIEGSGCGDRLLTSGSRVAIVCLSSGEIALDDLHGTHADVEGALSNLVSAAMADDGTLYLATADQQLATVAAGATERVSLPWPSAWSGSVLADGMAVAQGGASAVIAQTTEDGAWLRVFATNNVAQQKSLRLAGVPRGGILIMWPFAYYTIDSTVRHVDLISGLLETMTDVGAEAIPAAVVNG